MTTSLRFTAASDTGLMRQDNQDSGYAGPHLVAVADGVSGNAHGEVASAVTIDRFAQLDQVLSADAAPGALSSAVTEADDMLREMAEANPTLLGMSTTLTALLCGEDVLHLAHVGDSRAYRMRDGYLQQITKDHSLVQTLVDEGKLTPAEAAVHPQRSVILRAINGRGDVEADIVSHECRAGDRWLLCSDGLSDYVATQVIEETLAGEADLDVLARHLIDLANGAGGPDNITCVIADVTERDSASVAPAVVGSAAQATPGDDAGDEPTAKLAPARVQSLLDRLRSSQARVARILLPALAWILHHPREHAVG